MLTYCDSYGYWNAPAIRLPISFNAGMIFEQIRIPVGKLPDDCEVVLVLWINSEYELCKEDFEVYVNSAAAEYCGTVMGGYTHIRQTLLWL